MLTKVMRIGYWTAQEQHSMQQLLDFVVEAERTKKMHFMTGVTAPIYRYHPAIIA